MLPDGRIRRLNRAGWRNGGRYVLYWMIAHRRLRSNFALQHAAALALDARLPLVIFEPLQVNYRWASDRLHRFVIDGMADHARLMAGRTATYIPHVERARGEGRALFDALAAGAFAIVTDDYPSFFIPDMLARTAARLDVGLDAVDSNGLLPIRSAAQPFATAYAFRAFVQRSLRQHLTPWPGDIRWQDLPASPPLCLPDGAPPATPVSDLEKPDALLGSLPIDHSVPPAPVRGGATAAAAVLRTFVAERLPRYLTDSAHPDLDATSGLSPYLHFGHLSPHDVFDAVMTAERWTSRHLAARGGGRREGWWSVSPSAEAFLDQLVTWRELGFSTSATSTTPIDTIDALPAWARRTLDAHASDTRPVLYTREALETATTHDRVWNAAQRQMVRDGRMHNYLRMLWGKKILEWSPSAADALDTMIELMNRHALDGRDPNSYSGYTWTLGRYDRPWAPERPIFGTVRYMSSDNTVRKLKLKAYLETYGDRPRA